MAMNSCIACSHRVGQVVELVATEAVAALQKEQPKVELRVGASYVIKATDCDADGHYTFQLGGLRGCTFTAADLFVNPEQFQPGAWVHDQSTGTPVRVEAVHGQSAEVSLTEIEVSEVTHLGPLPGQTVTLLQTDHVMTFAAEHPGLSLAFDTEYRILKLETDNDGAVCYELEGVGKDELLFRREDLEIHFRVGDRAFHRGFQCAVTIKKTFADDHNLARFVMTRSTTWPSGGPPWSVSLISS